MLVPKIFLSKNTLKNINENQGNIIKAGGNLAINSSIVDNNGKIIAKDNVNINADNILQNGAYSDTGIYGENISLVVEENIENMGGNIIAQEDVLLFSKNGDIKNSKKLSIHENDLRNVFTDVRAAGDIKGRNISIVANNVENLGADIIADKKIEIGTRENLTIGNLDAVDQKISISKRDFVLDRKTTNVGSKLKAKDIELSSLKDINIVGSNIDAKNKLDINAKEDINIVAGKNTTLHEERHGKSKGFGRSSSSTDIIYNEDIVAAELKGKDINIISHKNANIIGGNIVATNDLNILAKEAINIIAAQKGSSEIHQKTKSGFMKLSGQASLEDNLRYSNVASKIGAEKDINLNSEKNVNVVASELTAGENINIKAKENVNILAADDKFKS
ncbi:MAG: hemagglutinin repeat-containing protein, partial [Fusobacterium sp.]|nr:hemagglutinin repeat-containing protein [Fusobacterium sp.]